MNTSLTSRRFNTFVRDAAERAAKTFAQAVLASGVVLEGVTLDAFLDTEPWSVGAAAAVVSVLTSIASRRVGQPNSASAIDG